LKRLIHGRPGQEGPHSSHRQSRRRQLRPALTIRTLTAAGFTLALAGGGIAVGTGALHTSGSTVKVASAANWSQASAKADPSDQYGDSGSNSTADSSNGSDSANGSGGSDGSDDSGSSPSYATATVPGKHHRYHHHAKSSAAPTATPAASTPAATPSATTSVPDTTTQPSTGSFSPQATAQNQTPTGQNQLVWSEAMLTALGAPLTNANITSLGYWMQNEAGRPPSGIVGANNPINVSTPADGGVPIQDDGDGVTFLQSYPTVQDGIAATVSYLNRPDFAQILAALKAGDGLTSSSLASEISEYSGNGYSTIPDSWGSSQGQPLT
jgi:hypothetical protein